MRNMRAVAILAFSASSLCLPHSRAAEVTPAGSPTEATTVTRVFYLKGMDTREAAMLLRSRVQIHRLAEVREIDAVIVRDSPTRVDSSETLLRDLDGISKTTTASEPVTLERERQNASVTRVFWVNAVDTRTVIAVLRSIYGIREARDSGRTSSISVQGALPDLDAAEVLLRGLGVLIPAPQLWLESSAGRPPSLAPCGEQPDRTRCAALRHHAPRRPSRSTMLDI